VPLQLSSACRQSEFIFGVVANDAVVPRLRGLPSVVSGAVLQGKKFQIIRANLYFVVLFGVVWDRKIFSPHCVLLGAIGFIVGSSPLGSTPLARVSFNNCKSDRCSLL